MSNWNEQAWFAFFSGAAVKSTMVLAVALIAARLLRGRSAAARHLVWTAAAAAVLALPFLSISLPKWNVPGAAAMLPASSLIFETTATATRDGAASSRALNRSTAAVPSPVRKTTRLDWPLLLMLLWAAGALASLAPAAVASASLARMRRRSRPYPGAAMAAELARSLGIESDIEVLETAPGAMPMTFGISRPTVFMPADSAQWTAERRRMVLLHELAHVRRGDAALHLIARAALSLYWWNPLAWTAWREFLKERERAADDLVLNAGERASEYAGHLLEVARTMRVAPGAAWASVAMARPSQLEGRLLAILDAKVDRKPPSRVSALAVAIAAAALVAPFAAIQAQDRAPEVLPPDVDATIRAATSQGNYKMLDQAAQAYENQRQYGMAQQLLEPALAIRGQVAGEQSAVYAAGLVKLGALSQKRGKAAQAAAWYTKAVALGDRPETAPALLYLGTHEHNDTEALNLLQRAANVAATPQEIGRALTFSAMVRQRQPDGAAEAESLFLRAIAVENSEYSSAATTMELYARMLDEKGREGEAKTQRDAAFAIRKPHLETLTAPMPAAAGPAIRANTAAGVVSPQLVSKVEPEYTEDARMAKLQGTVVLFVEIGPDGMAHHVRVVKSLGLGLDEKAIEAIGAWMFKPGSLNGSPVTVAATIEVNFRLL